MYFNENKENTNIDSEFSTKKEFSFDFEKYKIPIIVIGAIILLLIIILILSAVSKSKPKTEYFIDLEGATEIIIYKGTTYNDPGYKGYDNNDQTYDVKVEGTVDTGTVGEYTITYKLQDVTKTRTVKVMETPEIPTIIHLNGGKNITIKLNEEYKEPGYSVVDYVDGDLTNKVVITGSVNVTKEGIYRLVYSVVNSEGVTTSETRVVTVK